MRHVLLGRGAFALLALVAIPSQAQDPKTPEFPSAVELVAVEVSVLDKEGRPVRGLGPEEFAVTLDGKPRRVVSADFVPLGSPEGEGPLRAPHFSTNEGSVPGRLVLLAVDQGSIAPGGGKAVVSSADRFLDQLAPADRIGLVSLPGPGPHVEFTADHNRVRGALKGVVGRSRVVVQRVSLVEALAYVDHSAAWDQVVDRECGDLKGGRDPRAYELCVSEVESEAQTLAAAHQHRVSEPLKALAALFEGLKGIEGPKIVVLLSEGLAGDRDEIAALARLASTARVLLYVLRLEGSGADSTRSTAAPSFEEDQNLQGRGLDGLARLTGGSIYRVSTSGTAVFDRIAREISGYYLVAFEPAAGDRGSQNHKLGVTLSRQGLTLRFRQVADIPAAVPTEAQALERELRAPFEATGIPMRLRTYATPSRKDGKVALILSTEIGRDLGGTVGVAYWVLDASGRAVASGVRRLEAPEKSGPVPFVATAEVDPGTYTVKVAARDGRGRAGSVERTARATLLAAADLELSDLIVARPSGENAPLRPGIDVVTEGNLAAYLEIAGRADAALQKIAVTMEVGDGESGPALLSARARAAESGGTRASFQSLLPVGALPPGDYMVRARVFSGDRSLGVQSSPFHVAPRTASPSPGEAGARIPLSGLSAVIDPFDIARVLRPEVVASSLDRLKEVAPPSPRVQKAIELARSGHTDRLLEEVEHQESGSDLGVAFLRGLGFLAKGDTRAAATQFRTALRISSEFFPAVFYLGSCYAADGDDLQAVGAWQTSLVAGSAPAQAYAVLGDALLRVNEPQQASEILQEGSSAWPEDLPLKRRLGIAYAMTGERSRALPILTEYLDQHSEDTGALFVTLRLLFDAYQSQGASDPLQGDRVRLTRYAKAYVAAKGPQTELVAQWIKYLDRQAH